MALTKEKLRTIVKTDDFKSVVSLKLDGIQLTSCFKLLLQEFGITLFLLTLKNNSLTDIDITLGFFNLRKLDLSTNFLVSIGTKDLWKTMPKLQILYLHDNLIENWSSLDSLLSLPSILHLTLFNNPCIHLPDYRTHMIKSLASLLALDFYICTQEEKQNIMSADSEKAKIWIQDTTDIRNFKQHIYKLKRKWESCSPVIKIQSHWRRYCVKKNIGGHLSERDKKALIIQKHYRGWILRKKLKRDLEKLLRDTNHEELLYTPEEYLQYKAIRRIQTWYLEYKKRRDLRRKLYIASTKISSCYRKYKAIKFQLPFFTNLEVYIMKIQQRSLISILRALAISSSGTYHPANSIFDRQAPEFFASLPPKTTGYTFSELYDGIQMCNNIKVIRFPDIETLEYTGNPICQSVKWMRHAKIVNSGKSIQKKPISKIYCTESQYNQLNKFKNRGCNPNKFEKEKYNQIKSNYDDYNDIILFNSPSPSFMQEFIMLILEYNKYLNSKSLPCFIPIYKVLLDRVKAACMVQAHWRGRQVRKSNIIPLKAIRRRAVYSIQRWWRFSKFLYRMESLTRLKSILCEFDSCTVYLQEHLFENLHLSSSWYLFDEQEFEFYCRGSSVYLLNSIKGSYNLLPNWVGAQISFSNSRAEPTEEEKSLQAVVLSGARVEIVTLYSQILDSKVADSNTKFIKLEYSSVDELKRRASILYLKTLEHHNRSFIPYFTIKDLRNPFLMTKLRSVWNSKNIKKTEQCVATDILFKALSPIENQVEIIPKPPPAPIQRQSERMLLMPSQQDLIPIRNTISSQELLRKRVKRAKEEAQRRQTESRISQRINLETKVVECREAKEQANEIIAFRHDLEKKQNELKKNFIEAQYRKKQEVKNEREFVNRFAQAKNMLQKLMKNSDLTRWKHKSEQDVREKVLKFKQKSRERKEIFQSILYEKNRTKNNKTSIL
jgi:Leucine-rich repeat/IQ calmodulin-binding motif